MLSILIPTYNYNAYTLAELLETEALALNLIFEIICVDDGSFAHVNIENQKINHLTNSKFIENKKNLGRDGNRSYLAELAQYDSLLFIDADMIPQNENFLDLYVMSIMDNIDIIFGGIAYKPERPDNNFLLRWHYGHERESKTVIEREKHPYRSIIFGCFLIKRELFQAIDKKILENRYGQDTLFTYLLKTQNVSTMHINNPAYHLGLDKNLDFLNKTKQGVNTLFDLYNNKDISYSFSKLLRAYHFLRTLRMTGLFGKLISHFSKTFENNLLSSEPNLLYFDFYRLGYMCNLKKQMQK